MKQIGREVCFLRSGKGNPRNGECSFLRLLDGRIMCVYSKYYGNGKIAGKRYEKYDRNRPVGASRSAQDHPKKRGQGKESY